jgi:hypothetical protein
VIVVAMLLKIVPVSVAGMQLKIVLVYVKEPLL